MAEEGRNKGEKKAEVKGLTNQTLSCALQSKSEDHTYVCTCLIVKLKMRTYLFDSEAGDEVDHLWQLAELVWTHPGMEVALLLSGQWKETIWVAEILRNRRDGTKFGQVRIAPWYVHDTINPRGSSKMYILYDC